MVTHAGNLRPRTTNRDTTTSAGIYCRISRDEADKGLGVERQEEDCRRLCATRGWPVHDVYTDNDISASKYSRKPRPEYERLLNDIRSGNVSAVVVFSKDRLHRKLGELEDFVSTCEAAGITTITSASGDVNISDADSLAQLGMEVVWAKRESDKISQRIKRQRVQAAERGESKSTGGTRPYGFENDRETVREDEANRIREAARRIREGASLRSICADWNEQGVPTAAGGKWGGPGLRQILMSARVAGKRVHRKQVVGDAVWPAILDPATYAAVCTILRDPSRRHTEPKKDYPLRGVLICSECGKTLQSCPRRPHGKPMTEAIRNYSCRKGVAGGCGKVFVRANWTEDYVKQYVVPIADLPSTRQILRDAEGAEIAGATELIEANAADEAKLANLADLVADGTLNPVHVRKAAATLKADIAARNAKLAGLAGRSALDRLTGNVRKQWDTLSSEDKRAVLLSFCKGIVIAPSKVKGQHHLDRSRISIAWRVDALESLEQALPSEDGWSLAVDEAGNLYEIGDLKATAS